MDEQKETTKAKEAEDTTKDTPKGDEPQAGSILEQVNAAAERVEKALAEERQILQTRSELYAKEQLRGQTDAGVKVEKPKMSPEEYAERALKGEYNKQD